MRTGLRLLPIFSVSLVCSSVFCTGCSSLISYCGEDVGKLKNMDQVRESFGTPSKSSDTEGKQFDEFHTRRKISEPQLAGGQLIVGMGSFGLLELLDFPATVLGNAWTTLIGQDVRFEYGNNGEVIRILINGTSMEAMGQLP